jgi:FkbM family methyltransferase
MRVLRRLSRAIQAASFRAGYPMIPRWRLAKLQEAQHLQQLFAMLGVDCVLDVGANIGQYREYLRLHVGYTGRIVSFEPVAELFAILERERRGDPLWDLHRLALGEASGSAEIQVFAERTLSSFLPRNEAALREMGYDKYLRETELDRTEAVPVRRLDEIFETVVPADASAVFLKCDTQGTDLAVVRGARGCLARIAGMQVELPVREVYKGAPSFLDALPELTGLGYAVTGFVPVQRDSTLRVVNVDCVLVSEAIVTRLRAARRHAPGHDGRP